MPEVQVPPELVVNHLTGEVMRLNVELAKSLAAVDVLSGRLAQAEAELTELRRAEEADDE